MNFLFFLIVDILFTIAIGQNVPDEGKIAENRKKHISAWLSPLGTLHNRLVSVNDYELWKEYKRKHGKKYKSEKHEMERLKIFLHTLKAIKHHNGLYKEGKKQFELGINHFSDMTFDEYRRLNGYRRSFGSTRKSRGSVFRAPKNISVPDSFDWRDYGFVTAVKNQGTCGSCYAFSTTGSLEGQHKRKTGQLVSLSEQNIIDCSSKYGNNGCDGGLMDSAFEYVKENRGIDTEESYPYKGYKEKCHFKTKFIGSLARGFVDLPQGDEEKLKIAVATQGPISVAIDADHESFKSFYSDGVYYEEECSSVNVSHAVLVVGYGTHEKYGDYWIVKNSWGENWGDKGYVRMARNKNNNCGIASVASYPIV